MCIRDSVDQYNNDANWRAHFENTGPEIVTAAPGRVTHFVATVGTGGTFTGVGRYLKGVDRAVTLVELQPDSPFHGLEGLKHMETAIVPRIWDRDLADERLGVPTEAIGPSTRAYPGRGIYRKLEKDLFPDPQREPERYFAMAFSFPDSLSANWHHRWEVEAVRQLGMNLNEVCGMHLRVNILRASRDQIIERFSTTEISVLDSSTSQAICLEAGHPRQLPGFSEGLFTIQNLSLIHI